MKFIYNIKKKTNHVRVNNLVAFKMVQQVKNPPAMQETQETQV